MVLIFLPLFSPSSWLAGSQRHSKLCCKQRMINSRRWHLSLNTGEPIRRFNSEVLLLQTVLLVSLSVFSLSCCCCCSCSCKCLADGWDLVGEVHRSRNDQQQRYLQLPVLFRDDSAVFKVRRACCFPLASPSLTLLLVCLWRCSLPCLIGIVTTSGKFCLAR